MKNLSFTCIAVVIALAAAFSLVNSGYEITQIRNGLIAAPGETADFTWTPERPPEHYLMETATPPPEFQGAVRQVLSVLHDEATELEKALALARHLSSGPGTGGGGITSSTRDAYRIILSGDRGWCSDYSQVMNGLAHAAGIPIREWGMSFDDYTGDGHTFNEIYDKTLSQWVLIDSYYSLYVVTREGGRPLSALEFRERLASGESTDTIEVRPIVPERFGFKNENRALEYYREGVDRFYVYSGNNVFSYDANPLVSTLTPYSRALEETAGIAMGIRPRIRLVVTATNGPAIRRLFLRRNIFFALLVVLLLLIVTGLLQLRGFRRTAISLEEKPALE